MGKAAGSCDEFNLVLGMQTTQNELDALIRIHVLLFNGDESQRSSEAIQTDAAADQL
jgi:hypothetical protein